MNTPDIASAPARRAITMLCRNGVALSERFSCLEGKTFEDITTQYEQDLVRELVERVLPLYPLDQVVDMGAYYGDISFQQNELGQLMCYHSNSLDWERVSLESMLLMVKVLD